MRRINFSIAVVLSTLFLFSVASPQQTATTSQQAAASVRNPANTLSGGPDTVINCVGAQVGRIPLWTSTFPPNIVICNSGIYEASATGLVGILNPSPMAALDVNGSVNAASSYEIGEQPVLFTGSADLHSVFVGLGAGSASSRGNENTFVGNLAGNSNTAGGGNSFVGYQAGVSNLGGGSNSFFGVTAGYSNTSGQYNSAFGAGYMNTTVRTTCS